MKLSSKVALALGAICYLIAFIMYLTPPNEGKGVLILVGSIAAIIGVYKHLTDGPGK